MGKPIGDGCVHRLRTDQFWWKHLSLDVICRLCWYWTVGKQQLLCCFCGHPPIAMQPCGGIHTPHVFFSHREAQHLKFIFVLTGKSMAAMAFRHPSFQNPLTGLCHPLSPWFPYVATSVKLSWIEKTTTSAMSAVMLGTPKPECRNHHKVVASSRRAGS